MPITSQARGLALELVVVLLARELVAAQELERELEKRS